MVNIYNYSRLVILVINNLIGLIFSRVGYRDLGIYFSNKPGLCYGTSRKRQNLAELGRTLRSRD